MNLIYRICSTVWLLAVSAVCLVLRADRVVATVQSPDGSMTLNLLQDENNALFYQVDRGATPLITRSALGVTTSVGNFPTGLTAGKAETSSVDEHYGLPFGKASTYVDRYEELRLPFVHDDKTMRVVVRMYDDGIAYRYEMDGEGQLVVMSEMSECNVARKDVIYSQVYAKDYRSMVEVSDWQRESCLKHTALPLLVRTGHDYVLVSEAGVNAAYAAARLYTNDETQSFVYDIAGRVETALPFRSPWRVMLVGTLAAIVESTVSDNLNEPTALTDLSWIKPGRAAWGYGGEDATGYETGGAYNGYLSRENINEYIDWASEMGWEYFTLDRNWERANIDLGATARYAKSRGVGLFVWVNQNKLPKDDTGLRNCFADYKNKGMKGLKVEFWEDESQAMMQRYEQVLRVAAEQHLMVNLHACTKPTGLRRTWPNLITSEAVLSNAYYAESPNVITAVHNINNAVVRGSLGSTDYAPTDFADRQGKINYGTTWAHQLALSVAFESGLQHINDAPDNFRYHIAKGFLKQIPAVWDETRCIEAVMDSSFAVARRSGDDWYVAVLTNHARTWKLQPEFLSAGQTYNAYIYRDGNCPSDLRFEYREGLTADDKLSVTMQEQGGVVILLSPSAVYDRPEHFVYEAESGDNLIPFGVGVRTDVDSLCSGNEYVTSIAGGRPLTFCKVVVPETGIYALTFYYMSEKANNVVVEVNECPETRREYAFAATGADSGRGLGVKTVLVSLSAAMENKIAFNGLNDFAPSLDRIELSLVEAGEDTAVDDADQNVASGAVYVAERSIIIEQNGETRYLLLNSIGQPIEAGSFRDGRVSIPVAEAGVYLIKVDGEAEAWTEKVVVR